MRNGINQWTPRITSTGGFAFINIPILGESRGGFARPIYDKKLFNNYLFFDQ